MTYIFCVVGKFCFLTFYIGIGNEIRQQSGKILFAAISEILQQKQHLSVINVFSNPLLPLPSWVILSKVTLQVVQ